MLAENALTTLENAKNYLGIDLNDTSLDNNIYFYINSASAIIESYCERQFALKTYKELKQGAGFTKLILDNYPIVELTSLVVDGEPVDISAVTVFEDSGILYKPDGGFPSRVIGGSFLHPIPDQIQHNILVEYRAGYVLPKDATEDNPRTLPYDLEMACMRLIGIMKKDKEVENGQNLILKREQIGDWLAEYEPENKSTTTKLDYMDPDILNILDSYKRSEFFL